MSAKSMVIYAERARLIADDTIASGRRPMDRDINSAVALSILSRLELHANDRLLDIGSGFGMMTVPLSYFVQSVTAVDHADVLARMSARPNIEQLPGDFLTVDMGARTFTKAVAYSVVHYLGSHEDIIRLVDKAIGLLEDGGLLLIGDMPNDNFRARTVSTAEGQRVAIETGVRMVSAEMERRSIEAVLTLPPDKELPDFHEADVLRLLAHVRASGHHAYLLRQPPTLPFFQAREDLFIQKCVKGFIRDLFVVEQISGSERRWLGLGLREVKPQDCDMLYWWSQDPAVRAASIRTETFTIEQHREWFGRKFGEQAPGNMRWYILENVQQAPIASVRYERIRSGRPLWSGGPIAPDDGGTEVSISVALQARGQRLAAVALDKSFEHATKDLPGPFIALIRPENIASIKAFTHSGYTRKGREERMGVTLERYEK